jgi:hypothetical protein
LCRIHRGTEERIDETEVHRHLIRLVPHHCPYAMAIRLEGAETLDVLPHFFVLRVEDVRPVHVHHHTGVMSLGMAVARYVITNLEDVDVISCLGKLTGDDGTRKSGADDGNAQRHASNATS